MSETTFAGNCALLRYSLVNANYVLGDCVVVLMQLHSFGSLKMETAFLGAVVLWCYGRAIQRGAEDGLNGCMNYGDGCGRMNRVVGERQMTSHLGSGKAGWGSDARKDAAGTACECRAVPAEDDSACFFSDISLRFPSGRY